MIDLLALLLRLLLGRRGPLPVHLRLRLHLRAGDRVPCEACGAMVCVIRATDIFEGERLLCCGCAGAAERRSRNRE